jgi:hypothetical protein
MDPNSSIVRMTSSYRLRNITQRTSLPGWAAQVDLGMSGVAPNAVVSLPAQDYGPPVSSDHPLGEYVEDYEYVPGLGTLDQYNGRFTVTPQFPQGTYAYFDTIAANEQSVFPYLVGREYHGQVNSGMVPSVIEPVTTYFDIKQPIQPGVQLTAAGVLLVVGSNGNDHIAVAQNGPNGQTISVSGQLNQASYLPNSNFFSISPLLQTLLRNRDPNLKNINAAFPADRVRQIVMFLFDGNDQVNVARGLTIALVVIDGNGNDNVQAGNGNNTIILGNGNDNVQVGDGSNLVVAGNGNNHIQAGNGNNLIVGGLGQHTILVGDGSNILIDGSVQLTQRSDTLGKVLGAWNADLLADGANPTQLAADIASIRARLHVMYNTRQANTLLAGSGLDWFWAIFPRDRINPKANDLLN